MSEQLSLYFDTLEELSEKDQEYMSRKYRHVLEKLDEIDALLNETSNGWKTKRMSRVDLKPSDEPSTMFLLIHFL